MRLSETFNDGAQLLAGCERMGLEGIVSKPPTDADLFDVLSAVTITDPDAQDILWVSFKADDLMGHDLGQPCSPERSRESSGPHRLASCRVALLTR